MLTIHKHGLLLTDKQELVLPKYAMFLDFQVQRGALTTWWLVHDDNDTENRTLVIAGTGRSIEHPIDCLSHLGTVQVGVWVWHLFELLDVV